MTEKQRQKIEAEKIRVHGMRQFENAAVIALLRSEGDIATGMEEVGAGEKSLSVAFSGVSADDEFLQSVYICGIDEAGRGPLAGPVAAGAVILPRDHDLLFLNDSKKLTPKKREMLFEQIMEEAVAWAVGLVEPARIDEINILQATYEAMRKAIGRLDRQPSVLINDAVRIPDVQIPQIPVIKGDAKCISIAAASIMAKVTRDRIMIELDAQYPEYGFARHKGYGTREHIEAIRKYGPCPIHRRTFITKWIPG